MRKEWQQAPASIPRLDIRWLLKESVVERNMTPDDVVTSTTALLDEVLKFPSFLYFLFTKITKLINRRIES